MLLDRYDLEDERACNLAYLNVLKSLQSNPSSAPFWRAVSSFEAPEYRNIISKPMDLGTICKRVTSKFYGTNSESFREDVRLVWSNCREFNGEHDEITYVATDLLTLSENLFLENSL